MTISFFMVYHNLMIKRSELMGRMQKASKRSRVVTLIGLRRGGKTMMARQVDWRAIKLKGFHYTRNDTLPPDVFS